MSRTPAEHMRNSANVQESRDAEYGSAYKRHGPAIAGLFPNGVELETADDHARFAILTLLFGKLTRYCGSFANGGHEDSLTDMIAYTAMLKEVDEEAAARAGLIDRTPECCDPELINNFIEADMPLNRSIANDVARRFSFDETVGVHGEVVSPPLYDPRLDK